MSPAPGRTDAGAVVMTADQIRGFATAVLVRAGMPNQNAAVVAALSWAAGIGSVRNTSSAGRSESPAAEVESFGIAVLIVEPGAFRTGLESGAMQMSAELPAYAEIVGPMRASMREVDGKQPGGPAKAAAAIIAAPDADRADLRAWESVIRGTDFDA